MLNHRLGLVSAERPAYTQKVNSLKKTGFSRAIGTKKGCRTAPKAHCHIGKIADTGNLYVLEHSAAAGGLETHRHYDIESLWLVIRWRLRMLQQRRAGFVR